MASCVDVASMVSTSPLNLRDEAHPDFITLSYYKMFGFPTGLGALLVRRTDKNTPNGTTQCSLLREPLYFGGGTIALGVPGINRMAFHEDLSERLGSLFIRL